MNESDLDTRERERGESTGRRRKKILEIELWPCKKWMLILHTHTHTQKKFSSLKIVFIFRCFLKSQIESVVFFWEKYKEVKNWECPPPGLEKVALEDKS